MCFLKRCPITNQYVGGCGAFWLCWLGASFFVPGNLKKAIPMSLSCSCCECPRCQHSVRDKGGGGDGREPALQAPAGAPGLQDSGHRVAAAGCRPEPESGKVTLLKTPRGNLTLAPLSVS